MLVKLKMCQDCYECQKCFDAQGGCEACFECQRCFEGMGQEQVCDACFDCQRCFDCQSGISGGQQRPQQRAGQPVQQRRPQQRQPQGQQCRQGTQCISEDKVKEIILDVLIIAGLLDESARKSIPLEG